MNKHKNVLKSSLIFLVLFVLLGVATQIAVKASLMTVSIDVEDTAQIVNSTIANDGTASGGKYLKFKESVATGERPCQNPTTVTAPGSNLPSLAASASSGDCFYLRNGTYNFSAIDSPDGVIFEGESEAGVIINGSGKDIAFYGDSKEVTIRKMTFRNFDKVRVTSSGNRIQEYSAILGKTAVWSSSLASDWLVEEVTSHGGYVNGIFLGDDFTVRNSSFYDNGVTGIGGSRFVGGLLENNNVYSNGYASAGGVAANGAGIKVTWVDSTARPFIIKGNEVHDQRSGIWCDLDCQNVIIDGNTVYNHQALGIFFELSRGNTIKNNTVKNSISYDNWTGDWYNGCIATGESQDILIENNALDDCRSAIMTRETKRPASSETYLQGAAIKGRLDSTLGTYWVGKNITFRNNTVKNSKAVGLAVGPSAIGRTEQSTIRFENNSYDNPSAMTFWWDRQQLNYSQWQAAGRQ